MKKIITLACAAVAALSITANAADVWVMPGTYQGWKLEGDKFEMVDGVLTQKIAEIKGDFKVVKYDSEKGASWDFEWGMPNKGDIVDVNKEVALTFKGGDANLPKGKVFKNVTVTIVPGADNALTIKFVPESVEDEQDAWYLVGQAPLDWNFNETTLMTKAGDNTFTKVVDAATAADFRFKVNHNGAWVNSYVLPIPEGETKAAPVELNKEYVLAGPADDPNDIKIASDWTNVTVKITVDNGKVTMICTGEGGEDGIDAIEADNAPAVYYNLMGQRVANPENGLFIRVQNGKSSKVIL